MTRSTRVLALLALLTLTAVAAACVPPPGASTGPAAPARGCYDRVAPGAPDVSYTGEPTEYENLLSWASTDGSCSSSTLPAEPATSMLVVAPTAAQAGQLCELLLRTRLAGTVDEIDGPFRPAFGSMAFRCAA